MPHFKCEACRTRLHTPSALADPVGSLCPDCGALLTRAGKPSELMGFRAITPQDEPRDPPGADDAPPVADLFARRACHEQARIDFERWIDDGGRLAAEAISMPRPKG